MPALSTEHVDVNLTNVSLAYKNEMYVADKVFKRIPVPKISDKYFVYDKNTFLRGSGVDAQGRPNSIRKPGSRSMEINYAVSSNSFYCEQLARNYKLTDLEAQYADTPLMPEVDATEAITERIMIDNELAVATKSGKRANYPTANKIQLTTGTTSWAVNTLTGGNYTSFPISADIPNLKRGVMLGIIKAPTHILMNYATQEVLAANHEYKDQVKYTSRDGLTKGGLAPVILGLEVLEANAQYATSSDYTGSAFTSGYTWVDDQGQDTALVFYGGNPARLKEPSFGATFEAPDPTTGGMGYVVEVWREQWIQSKVIEVRTSRDWKFTATDGSSSGDSANGFATGGALISGTTL